MNEADDEYKPDNISTDTVDTYVYEPSTESCKSDKEFNIYSQNYKATSNNLKYEIELITRLRLALNRVDTISSDDIGLLLTYVRSIDQLICVLADIHHTIKALEEFDRVFHLQKCNEGGRINIKVLTRIRRRRRRIKKSTKKRLKI